MSFTLKGIESFIERHTRRATICFLLHFWQTELSLGQFGGWGQVVIGTRFLYGLAFIPKSFGTMKLKYLKFWARCGKAFETVNELEQILVNKNML